MHNTNSYTNNKYNILVDGVVVGSTSENYFIFECPDFENHEYTVVYVDADYNVSCEQTVEYKILPLAVNELDVVNAIYPNPTSGDLHIKANDMVRISIVNTLGQMVYNQAVKCNETVINMANFEAGIYMVNVITTNGTSVKRVVVTK